MLVLYMNKYRSIYTYAHDRAVFSGSYREDEGVRDGGGGAENCRMFAHTLTAILSDAPVASRNSKTSDFSCELEGGMVGCGMW